MIGLLLCGYFHVHIFSLLLCKQEGDGSRRSKILRVVAEKRWHVRRKCILCEFKDFHESHVK